MNALWLIRVTAVTGSDIASAGKFSGKLHSNRFTSLRYKRLQPEVAANSIIKIPLEILDGIKL